MIEYIPLILIGVLLGVLTGVLPGLHPNTVVFITLPVYLATSIDIYIYMSILAGLSVSHTFHEFLPSIILGAPEAESALSALPGAEMTMNGEAKKAFKYSVFGGISSLIALIAVFPIVYYLATNYYSSIEPAIPLLLVFFLGFIAASAHDLKKSVVIIILSGTLGILSFEIPVNSQYVLVSIFSGLFAVPAIVNNLKQELELPEQKDTTVSLKKSSSGGFIGMLAGLLAGIVPGIGSAVATSFVMPLMSSERDGDSKFIAGMGAVNTVDIVVSFLALYLIGNPRSGAAVALQNLIKVELKEVVFVAGASLFAVSLTIPICLKTMNYFLNFVRVFDFSRVLKMVFVFLIFVNYVLTGLVGLLIFATSAFIGWAALEASERSSCMAVLLVPTTIFLTDIGIFM